MHSKYYEFKKDKTIYILKRREYLQKRCEYFFTSKNCSFLHFSLRLQEMEMLVKVVYADVQSVTHLRPIKGRNRLGLVRALIGTLRSSLIGLALDPLVCLWQPLFAATSLTAHRWRGNDVPSGCRAPGHGAKTAGIMLSLSLSALVVTSSSSGQSAA